MKSVELICQLNWMYTIFKCISFWNWKSYLHNELIRSGVDPGFLGRGFICLKVWGFASADFISFFLNIPIPWKWNNLVSLKPNYFIFIRYLKMGGGGGREGGFKLTTWTPSGSATEGRICYSFIFICIYFLMFLFCVPYVYLHSLLAYVK